MSFDREAFEKEVDAAIEEVTTETQEAQEAEETKEAEETTEAQETGETASVEEENETTQDGGETGETGETSETGEVSETGETETVTISDDALTEAVRAGIPLEQARQFSSEQALRGVVQAINEALDFGREESGDTEESQEDDPFAVLPTLDPDSVDPEVAKMLDAMKEIARKQHEEIKQLRSQHEATAKASGDAAAKEVEAQFDKQVEALGEDFVETLGTGPYASLSPGSSHLANRDKIASQMAVMMAGYRAMGQEPPAFGQVFDTAARVVLHDQFASLREKQLSQKLADRSGKHINRAGGKQQRKDTNPLDETAAMLDEKFFPKGR